MARDKLFYEPVESRKLQFVATIAKNRLLVWNHSVTQLSSLTRDVTHTDVAVTLARKKRLKEVKISAGLAMWHSCSSVKVVGSVSSLAVFRSYVLVRLKWDGSLTRLLGV